MSIVTINGPMDLTSLSTTISPTAYAGLRPPAALVTVDVVNKAMELDHILQYAQYL